MELFEVVTVEEALDSLHRHFCGSFAPPRDIPITEALGMRLAVIIDAPEDLPGFSRSIVDGLAVRAADTFGASEAMPAYLQKAGEIMMGQKAVIPLPVGAAFFIATGGMLPPGADAVVMIEHTEELDLENIGVTRQVAPGENIIQKGEDFKTGELVFPAGHRLRPQDIGVLAGLGITTIPVNNRLRVGIISTGDEIVSADNVPEPGRVRDINSYTLAAMVRERGGEASLYGIVPDSFERLREVLTKALELNDLVLLSGGSSVGVRDVTEAVISSFAHAKILFHGVALRPGKPTIGAVINNRLVFGLPGHPASAVVSFESMVAPFISGIYWAGVTGAPRQLLLSRKGQVEARLSKNVASGAGREDHVRVRLSLQENELWAEPVLGKSGLMRTLVLADGLVSIPLHKEGLQAGELVRVKII